MKGKRCVERTILLITLWLLRHPVLHKQRKCRSYEYQVRMFNDHLELELWVSRGVGDGLSYDFKLGCQRGSEKVGVNVWPEKEIQDPRVDEVRVRVG